MTKMKSNLLKNFDRHYANRGRSLLLAQQLGGACAYADDAFPKSKLRLVQVWVDLHAAELLENWRLIGTDKKFFRIAPLEVR